MSMNSRKTARALCLVMAILLLPLQAAVAQETSSKGVGTVEFGGWRGANNDIRREAVNRAKVNAIERYVSKGDQSQLKEFDAIRDRVRKEIDDYVLSATVISEDVDKKARRFTVVVRADLNVNRLRNALQGNSAVMNTASSERSELIMVFVAREQLSVKSFKEKKYTREDVEEIDEGADLESAGPAGIEYAASSSRSVSKTSGGSSTHKADQIEYDVSSAANVNAAMSNVFTTAGFEVIEAEMVKDETDGLLDVDAFREDFRYGDDISGATLRNAVKGAQSIDVSLLALGTLDVGVKDTDPVSGLARVSVSVTGKVLNLAGRFPKTIASVGPVQYAGTGRNQTVARTNALKLAAESAAHQLTNQLNAKGVK
jgi:hypothetical protein